MLFLVNRPWNLFSLGHFNLYYLTSCDIPSLDLVIYFKCFFSSSNVKSRKTTPPPVCKAKCPQWQGMAYKMCISSMAYLGLMKLVWTTPIFLEFSIYNTYFSYIITILLNTLLVVFAIVIILAMCVQWVCYFQIVVAVLSWQFHW
jgi:hypothetical protein